MTRRREGGGVYNGCQKKGEVGEDDGCERHVEWEVLVDENHKKGEIVLNDGHQRHARAK